MRRLTPALAIILLGCATAGRTKALGALPRCAHAQAAAADDWVQLEQGNDFSLRLPTCFQPGLVPDWLLP